MSEVMNMADQRCSCGGDCFYDCADPRCRSCGYEDCRCDEDGGDEAASDRIVRDERRATERMEQS